jgi:twitching motility protein PilI
MADTGKQVNSIRDVLEYLVDMESKCQSDAAAIPATTEQKGSWHGLAFKLGGVKVLSAMEEITEMLPYPDAITPVPGSKEWILGLANVRGNLMPIIDLQLYLGESPVVPGDTARVLVIKHHGVTTGLLVPKVFGMKNMPQEEIMEDLRFRGVLGAYVFDAFNAKGNVWPVFSMAALVADQRFLMVKT